jgi:hypothetical protein
VKKTVRMEYAQRWIVTYSSPEKKEGTGEPSYRHLGFPLTMSMVKEISSSLGPQGPKDQKRWR